MTIVAEVSNSVSQFVVGDSGTKSSNIETKMKMINLAFVNLIKLIKPFILFYKIVNSLKLVKHPIIEIVRTTIGNCFYN